MAATISQAPLGKAGEERRQVMANEGFDEFPSWTFLLAWVELEGVVYYHAPFDIGPKRVFAKLVGQGTERRIRVEPISGTSFDPFKADEGHLSRFKRLAQAPGTSELDYPESVREKAADPDSVTLPGAN